MKIISPSYSEIAWLNASRIMSLNPLALSGYFNQLFLSMRPLLDEDENAELDMRIKQIEVWLSDKYNSMKLYEIEMRMFQNMDLYSGFEVNGVMITQMEINEKLESIKQWLQELLYDKMRYIRFSQSLKI